jgi:hypothetical protein
MTSNSELRHMTVWTNYVVQKYVAWIYGLLFPNVFYILTSTNILGDFFTNLYGHPDDNVNCIRPLHSFIITYVNWQCSCIFVHETMQFKQSCLIKRFRMKAAMCIYGIEMILIRCFVFSIWSYPYIPDSILHSIHAHSSYRYLHYLWINIANKMAWNFKKPGRYSGSRSSLLCGRPCFCQFVKNLLLSILPK